VIPNDWRNIIAKFNILFRSKFSVNLMYEALLPLRASTVMLERINSSSAVKRLTSWSVCIWYVYIKQNVLAWLQTCVNRCLRSSHRWLLVLWSVWPVPRGNIAESLPTTSSSKNGLPMREIMCVMKTYPYEIDFRLFQMFRVDNFWDTKYSFF